MPQRRRWVAVLFENSNHPDRPLFVQWGGLTTSILSVVVWGAFLWQAVGRAVSGKHSLGGPIAALVFALVALVLLVCAVASTIWFLVRRPDRD